MSGFVLGFFFLLLTRLLRAPKPNIEDDEAWHTDVDPWPLEKIRANLAAGYLKVCPQCRHTYTKWCGYCGLPEFNGANPAPPPQVPAAKPLVIKPDPVLTDPVLTDDPHTLSADEVISAVQRRLYRMTIEEKVVAALNGTREERSLLIRHPDQRVYSAVLSSPKLTDAEVESFAAMNVSGQVLRQISLRPEWVKNPAVLRNLVSNPRTPVAVQMRLFPLLATTDLKSLSGDRTLYEPSRRRGGGGGGTPFPARSSSH